jgi:hypothetical protein
MPNYGDPDYWDKRYAKHMDPFDWLEDFESLRPFIEAVSSPTDRVL